MAVGPNDDFEIRDNNSRQGNGLGSDRSVPEQGAEADLTGNTVDTAGSSAAQLPQKNILERKEVLIGK